MTEPEQLLYGQDVIDDLTDDRDLWKARAILAKARVKKLEAIILQVTDAVYGKLQWSLEASQQLMFRYQMLPIPRNRYYQGK